MSTQVDVADPGSSVRHPRVLGRRNLLPDPSVAPVRWTAGKGKGRGFGASPSAGALLLFALALPAVAQDQGVIHKETYSQRRESCQITSPGYSGKCQFTVISFGKSMNIHFDLDALGHTGLTFISNDPRREGDGLSVPLVGVWERFERPSPATAAGGECVISQGLQEISCITSDGLYRASAAGLLAP